MSEEFKEVKSNVITQERTSQIISDTLKSLTEMLSKSLGPYGSTTIIEDRLGVNHVITKDGYTILNRIKFDSQISSTILDLVKKISRNLVKEVGDGSTSAIVVSNALYVELASLIEKFNIPRKDIIDVLEVYQNYIESKLTEKAILIDENNFDKIKSIASVSNNNDEKAGDLIFDIYKKVGVNGFINLETSTADQDSFEVNKGIELPRGYISNIYANKPDKVTAEFEKPLIFVANESLDEGDLEMLADITGKCLTLKKPFIVIAKGFDSEVKNFFHINKQQQRTLEIAIIDYAILNKHHRDSIEDLAIYLGATLYDKYSGDVENVVTIQELGTCERAIINEHSSKFITGSGDRKLIDERIKLIEEDMLALEKKEAYIDVDEDRFKFRKRIANLNCLIATLYIGGNSDLERETRKFLMEDAVFACQSALKSGYVSGGNLIIPRLINENSEEIIKLLSDNTSLVKTVVGDEDRRNFFDYFSKALDNAFTQSFRTVLTNKHGVKSSNVIDEILATCIEEDSIYNLKTDEFEDINTTSIINSVKTDAEIMKATFSIIGLLVTSNQFVAVTYQ